MEKQAESFHADLKKSAFSKMMKKSNWWQDQKIWKWSGKALGAALSVVVLAGLYFTLVIAQPQSAAEAPQPTQAPRPGAPAQRVTSEGELRTLVQSFPAPVMSFMSGSGMVFVSGEAEDAADEEGQGRILTLYWQTEQGTPLMLQSIYPAEAMTLLGKGDYHFSDHAGPALCGQNSVRMENADTVRVHIQLAGNGIYAVTIPQELSRDLSDIVRSIQLFTAD